MSIEPLDRREMTSYRRPRRDPHDWAAVSRWEDAGRPPIGDVPAVPVYRTVFCVDEKHRLCDGTVHVAREGQLFSEAEQHPCSCSCHRSAGEPDAATERPPVPTAEPNRQDGFVESRSTATAGSLGRGFPLTGLIDGRRLAALRGPGASERDQSHQSESPAEPVPERVQASRGHEREHHDAPDQDIGQRAGLHDRQSTHTPRRHRISSSGVARPKPPAE